MNLLENTILPILLSGIIAVIISGWQQRRFNILMVKRDVLRRFVGNRYALTESLKGQTGEPFIALNEIFVVYAKDQQVIAALKKMHEELRVSDRLSDNIVTLTKAMAKAAKVPINDLNDEFITRPFTPPSKGC
ncbi:MAG: hypothetical protein OXG62_13580 [Nitrospinae bacterium]|nr:hypothetical protein [Nitrospinota bacterium]